MRAARGASMRATPAVRRARAAPPRQPQLAAAGVGRVGRVLAASSRSTRQLGAPAAAAFIAAGLLGAALSLVGATPWRRVFIGVRLSALVRRLGQPPARCRPGPGCCRSRCSPFVYPLAHLARRAALSDAARRARAAWRDACRSRRDAARPRRRLRPGRRAWSSCGASIPQAPLEGIEWSRPLAARCARCAAASRDVRRGDLWAADWSRYALVYLFQRPESHERAPPPRRRSELRPGAWLASLEFEIATLVPEHVLEGATDAASGSTGRRFARRGLSRRRAQAPSRQPPLWGRLPGFFLRVDLPRSRLRFWPVGRVVVGSFLVLSPLGVSLPWSRAPHNRRTVHP